MSEEFNDIDTIAYASHSRCHNAIPVITGPPGPSARSPHLLLLRTRAQIYVMSGTSGVSYLHQTPCRYDSQSSALICVVRVVIAPMVLVKQ